MTGEQVQVIAAGGLFNGQSLAAALMLGATAVWIGTRFVLSEEAGAPKAHQEAVRTAGFDDNIRTIIFTVSSLALDTSGVNPRWQSTNADHRNIQGRPLRVRKNPYIENWEENRQAEIKELTARGKIPVEHDLETMGDDIDDDTMDNARPFLMGKVAAVVNEKKSAKAIIDEMVDDAVSWLNKGNSYIASKAKL